MNKTKMWVTKEPENGDSNNGKIMCAENYTSVIIKPITIAKTIVIGSAAIIAFMFFSSCARKAVFQVSPVVPAARGYAKVKRDYNKNYNIYVKLENLAEPERLTPPKKTYIVWLVANDNSTKNVGQVKTSTSLLSHTLRGTFETVSATKPIKVFITAEDDPTVQFPGSILVMTTKGF
jgi:hypothetical protein